MQILKQTIEMNSNYYQLLAAQPAGTRDPLCFNRKRKPQTVGYYIF